MSEIVIPKIDAEKRARQQQIIIKNWGLGDIATRVFQKQPAPNEQDVPLYMSSLGTPVWTNLVVQAQTYTDPITNLVYNVPQFILDTVLITITNQKTIIRTPIQGLDNPVTEYISGGGWGINIKGGVFGKMNQRPVQDIAKLKAVCNAKIALTVNSPFLAEWDIGSIVLDNINIPQEQGGYSYQMFNISAFSEVPIILQL